MNVSDAAFENEQIASGIALGIFLCIYGNRQFFYNTDLYIYLGLNIFMIICDFEVEWCVA